MGALRGRRFYTESGVKFACGNHPFTSEYRFERYYGGYNWNRMRDEERETGNFCVACEMFVQKWHSKRNKGRCSLCEKLLKKQTVAFKPKPGYEDPLFEPL